MTVAIGIGGCSSGFRTVDASALSKVPESERASLAAAGTASLERADAAVARAERDLAAAREELEKGRAERRDFARQLETAKKEQSAASRAGDPDRSRLAEHEVALATALRDVGQAKLDWLEAKVKLRQREVTAARRQRKAAVGKHELERAAAAHRHSTVDEPFDTVPFRNQHGRLREQSLEAQRQVASARTAVNERLARLMQAKRRYSELHKKSLPPKTTESASSETRR